MTEKIEVCQKARFTGLVERIHGGEYAIVLGHHTTVEILAPAPATGDMIQIRDKKPVTIPFWWSTGYTGTICDTEVRHVRVLTAEEAAEATHEYEKKVAAEAAEELAKKKAQLAKQVVEISTVEDIVAMLVAVQKKVPSSQ